MADGIPARVDRLRCLGNSLVPEIPFLIFRAIERAECELLYVPGSEEMLRAL